MRLFKFILSHSIFVAFCAGALAYQSFILLRQPMKPEIFGLVFFCTLSAYNLYWMLCKRSNERKEKTTSGFNAYSGYFILMLAGAVAVLDYLWQMPYYFPLIIITSLFTFLYLLPVITSLRFRLNRHYGFVKTLLLALTWSLFTVGIPAVNLLQDRWQEVSALFVMRFTFMLMLCIIFDSRDFRVDTLSNLAGFGKGFNRKKLTLLMLVVLLSYVMAVFMVNNYCRNEWILFNLLVSGALAFLLFLLSFKPRGYYFYYFWVDGMMCLSALSVYLTTI